MLGGTEGKDHHPHMQMQKKNKNKKIKEDCFAF